MYGTLSITFYFIYQNIDGTINKKYLEVIYLQCIYKRGRFEAPSPPPATWASSTPAYMQATDPLVATHPAHQNML